MSIPGSVGSAFARPSLATIVVIPSRVVNYKWVEDGGYEEEDAWGVCTPTQFFSPYHIEGQPHSW